MGVIQVVSPLSLCSSPMLKTLVGLKNLFLNEVWSDKGILESLSAFLMPCAIIETCSMAWLSCSRIPQATFWGLFWERCTIGTLPNYLAWVYQSKSPLGRSHCITVDAIPRRGNLNVRTVIIRHPVSGTLGKQTCSELTQSVKHWEAQTPLSKVKIPLEKVPLLTQLPGKAGGLTDPHTARRFTRMRVWLWNGKHPLRRCGLMLSVKWWPFLLLKDQGLMYFFLLAQLVKLCIISILLYRI